MTIAQSLLYPRSVAIVGASDDLSKPGSRPLRFLLASDFQGRIFPVNARRDTVLGVPAWASIDALEETPDHVFIAAPTTMVHDAVAACVSRGVPLVTVLAGGFGEGGGEEETRKSELLTLVRGSGTRLLGPNSIGVVNLHNRLVLTANAAFAEDGLPVGGLFVASHSGSMIGSLVSRGIAKGVGFSGLVSTGMELDLSLGEICAATLDDPRIDSYALFLETIHHARDIRHFACEAARRGKPVVAYKLGRSSQAAELAQSHTGAIAGEDGIADAFLKDCGIARVETLDALLEAPALLRRLGPAAHRTKKPRVAVVTTTGGGAAMVVDQLGIRDVDVVGPNEETLARMAKANAFAAPGRIVDLTLAGTRTDVMQAALEALLDEPDYDLVIAVAGSSARFHPEILVEAIKRAAVDGARIAAFLTPDAPQAAVELTASGIPCFRTPEACGDAVAAAFARRPAKRPPLRPQQSDSEHFEEWQIDEYESYAILEALGIEAAEHALIPLDAEQSPIEYPVAVKILSSELLHKSDLGGVHIGIENDEELKTSSREIAESVKAAEPNLTFDKLLVQKMVRGVGEVLLSFHDDPEAGPMVMLAAGGVLADLLKDRSLRTAPVTRAEAEAMIGEVKSLAALAGYRGKEKGDLHALADAIMSISQAGPDIVSAEINPLVVLREGEGVKAVDAVVRVRTRGSDDDWI